MSYESPIEIVCREMKNQLENGVYSVVQSYGIKVDKGELINALEYDRNQYEKGYADAKAKLERKKGEWIDEINSYTSRTYCSECGSSAPFVYKSDDYYGNHAHGETAKTKFCPNCGADMRGE